MNLVIHTILLLGWPMFGPIFIYLAIAYICNEYVLVNNMNLSFLFIKIYIYKLEFDSTTVELYIRKKEHHGWVIK
jgi:hypothetical protein